MFHVEWTEWRGTFEASSLKPARTGRRCRFAAPDPPSISARDNKCEIVVHAGDSGGSGRGTSRVGRGTGVLGERGSKKQLPGLGRGALQYLRGTKIAKTSTPILGFETMSLDFVSRQSLNT